MNRKLLEAPFLDSEIKMRQGNHGTVSYVDGATVIARLNEAFEGEWSFEVTDYCIDSENSEVRCLGKLTAGNVVKMQFGSSAITRKDNKPLSIGDDLKASATDACKKAATLLGVRLPHSAEKPESSAQREHGSVPSQGQSSQNGSKGISTRQLGYLLTLGRGRKMTPSQVDALAEEKFGTVLSFLTKAQASTLISELRPPEKMTQEQPSVGRTERDVQ